MSTVSTSLARAIHSLWRGRTNLHLRLGMFLPDEPATQVGTMALVPQVADAVSVPVIAAGGIAEARGIAAAFALGAAGVQMGTAYLLCPEAITSAAHRAALQAARDDSTAVTNLFTGRPARGVVNRLMRELGPVSRDVPDFPLAADALARSGLPPKRRVMGISALSGRGRQHRWQLRRRLPS